MNEEQEFFTKLTGLAGMVPNFNLTEEIIMLYDQHLSRLGYDKVCSALDRIIINRNSRDPFPSIKEIRDLISPELTDEQEARAIASRIIGAVARIGPYRVSTAREFLGEVAWAVVQSEGGWETVCTVLTNDNLGILKAQWRDLAETFLARRLVGVPLLESKPRQTGLSGFGNNVKSITDRYESPDEEIF